jgi:peptidoglycan/LPS O-acetylase OafA/YrhL
LQRLSSTPRRWPFTNSLLAMQQPSAAAAAVAQLISESFSRRGGDQRVPSPTRPAAGPAAAAAGPASYHSSPLDLRPLNGLRALASIAVVLYHSWILWSMLLPYDTASRLTRRNVLVTAVSLGPLAVDLFLILTGLLAAYQLVPALERSADSWRAVLRYWRRRALRLLPAYLATNLVLLAAQPATPAPEAALARTIFMGNCPAGLWRNLAFLVNFRNDQACGGHLWTLSLQVQFYAAFPLLLLALRPRQPGFRTRLAWALAAAAGAGTVWRLALAWSKPASMLQLPFGDLRQPAGREMFISVLRVTYFTPAVRMCQLAVGAALGLLLRSHAGVSWLARRQACLAVAAAALQAAYLYQCAAWNPNGMPGEALWTPTAARAYTALCYYGSPFLSALLAVTILALMLRCDPLHGRIASALSSPALLPLAHLSFSLYLIHEPARLWALSLLPAALPAAIATSPLWGLTSLCAVTLAAAYPAALLLHQLVEKRF